MFPRDLNLNLNLRTPDETRSYVTKPTGFGAAHARSSGAGGWWQNSDRTASDDSGLASKDALEGLARCS